MEDDEQQQSRAGESVCLELLAHNLGVSLSGGSLRAGDRLGGSFGPTRI